MKLFNFDSRAIRVRLRGMLLATLLLQIVNVLVDAEYAQAASPDEFHTLELHAVNVFRTPRQTWPGYGIYLGRGRVITAAHVLGRVGLANPTVDVSGQVVEARVLKQGDFEGVDLTLLEIDERQLPAHIGLRLVPVCETDPRPGQAVVVVIPGSFARSTILSPVVLPKGVRGRFDTVISDVATTGNSGSGVFDAAKQCLLGIMSRKIQRAFFVQANGATTRRVEDVAKYFVPASKIREFTQAFQ